MLDELQHAAAVVHATLPPTPQISWPLLSARAGCDLWVKHENHTPVGSFKLRGALLYVGSLGTRPPGLIAATRGNFGQSMAFAARRVGIPMSIVVPHGNSREKNAAMRAMGANLIECGEHFEEAFAHAERLAAEHGLHMTRSFHPLLVKGVASLSLELFGAVPDIDTMYVAIGQGSAICGAIAVRDALGLRTEIVGVVSERLPSYARSFEARRAVGTAPAETIADGVAIRAPVPDAVDIISRGAARVITVSEDAIRAAMRHYFTDTHNVAEGAGAVTLAGALSERQRIAGKRVAVVLSGGNVDRPIFRDVLAEEA
jgi:threonine dehydratase